MVKTGEKGDTMKRKKAEVEKTQGTSLVRASISFPPDVYETLEQIAKQKKVSLAWVVRDAAEKYITNKRPVLAKEQQPS